MRLLARIALVRANAAAAPRDARPMPPAKRGLLKSASKSRMAVGSFVGESVMLSWEL